MSVKAKKPVKEPVKQAEPAPPVIEFDAAVKLGKDLVATIQFNEMELGRLADRVHPTHGAKNLKYGTKTLLKFAEAIGVPYGTLKKYRSVYRKWKDKDIGEISPPFAVLSSLPAEAADLLKASPKMTTPEARGIARAAKAAKAETNAQPKEPWMVIETRRWFNDAMEAARKTYKFGHPVPERHDPAILRAAVADLDQLVAVLRKGALALTTAAAAIEDALASRPVLALPPPDFDDAKPAEAAE